MPKSLHSERHLIIAAALKAQRKAKGVSQVQLADALGRRQPFIHNVETGERRLDLVELLDIADIIGLDIDALIKALRDWDRKGP